LELANKPIGTFGRLEEELMQRYSYSIDVRIWHPNIATDMITRALGISPSRSCEAGKPRSTPKGTPLEGTYRESYWSADPFDHGERSSTDDLIEDALTEVLQLLEPNKDFLLKLRSEGARILVQISSFSGRNYAFELPPELMSRYAAIGVSLAHDVYPCTQSR
jgi:hypothetical protein